MTQAQIYTLWLNALKNNPHGKVFMLSRRELLLLLSVTEPNKSDQT